MKAELTRRRDALAQERHDLDRRGAAIDDRDDLDTNEAALDGARRKLVARWTEIDEFGRILRSESTWLDERRAALADEEKHRRELRDRIKSIEHEMSDIHRLGGHSVEYESLRKMVSPMRRDHDAHSERLSARITEYNHRYDALIGALNSQIPHLDEIITGLKDWRTQRHGHNDAINKFNTDRALVDAGYEVLRHEDISLREDIRAYLGPFRLTVDAKNKITHQFNTLIWTSKDRNIAGLQFELVCVDLLRRMDLDVTHTGGSNDQGIDIRAAATTPTGGQYRYLIQCKLRSGGSAIGVNTIATFVGRLPERRDYDKAAVITSGDFDDAARTHAAERDIELWDGAWLLERLVTNNVGFNLRFAVDGYSVGVNSEYWDDLARRTSLADEHSRV